MSILTFLDNIMPDAMANIRGILGAEQLVKDMLVGGAAAVTAFEQAAPDAAEHLRQVTDALKKKKVGADAPPATDAEVATVAAHIVGVPRPDWASPGADAWMGRQDEGVSGDGG